MAVTIIIITLQKTFGCFDQAIGSSELQHDNPTMFTEAYPLQCLMVPNFRCHKKQPNYRTAHNANNLAIYSGGCRGDPGVQRNHPL